MRSTMVVLAAVALVLGTASFVLQGPLPGDVAISRALQSIVPATSPWIEVLSATAGWPIIGISALVVGIFAASLAGLRGAGGALAGMALAMVAERGLRAVLFVPRPSPEAVAVASYSASSGLPSTFAIFYGAAMAALVMLSGGKASHEAMAVRYGALVLLTVGCAGRVAAGGHWTSQVIASAALGALASAVAMRVMRAAR